MTEEKTYDITENSLRLGTVWLILAINSLVPIAFGLILKWRVPWYLLPAAVFIAYGLWQRNDSVRCIAIAWAIITIPLWALYGSMFGMVVFWLGSNPGKLPALDTRPLIGSAIVFGLIALAINLPLIRKLRSLEAVQAFRNNDR